MRENCPSTAFSVFFLLVFGSNAGNNIDTVWPVPYAVENSYPERNLMF